MKILGIVENGPENRWLKFGDVLDSGGKLTFDHHRSQTKIKGQEALIINQPTTLHNLVLVQFFFYMTKLFSRKVNPKNGLNRCI